MSKLGNRLIEAALEGREIARDEANKAVWNAAIEAAALIADEADEIAATDIRKLKK